jgi:hypothetical protein
VKASSQKNLLFEKVEVLKWKNFYMKNAAFEPPQLAFGFIPPNEFVIGQTHYHVVEQMSDPSKAAYGWLLPDDGYMIFSWDHNPMQDTAAAAGSARQFLNAQGLHEQDPKTVLNEAGLTDEEIMRRQVGNDVYS